MRMNPKMPWSVQSFLNIMQRSLKGEGDKVIELPNGENFKVTPETTQREMMLAQSRCVSTFLVSYKNIK